MSALLERFGPFVPASGRLTSVVLAVVAGIVLVVLVLVEDRDVECSITVLLVIGAALLLSVAQARRARGLGLRRAHQLPPVPLVARLAFVVTLVSASGVLVRADRLYSGWWGLMMVAAFATDDLVRRRAFAPVLRPGGYQRQPRGRA